MLGYIWAVFLSRQSDELISPVGAFLSVMLGLVLRYRILSKREDTKRHRAETERYREETYRKAVELGFTVNVQGKFQCNQLELEGLQGFTIQSSPTAVEVCIPPLFLIEEQPVPPPSAPADIAQSSPPEPKTLENQTGQKNDPVETQEALPKGPKPKQRKRAAKSAVS